MALITKLIKNTGYLTIGSQIGNLLQFLFFLYFARQFGEKIVGQYSFAFSFTYVFSVLADLGLSAYVIREVARDRTGNRQIFIRCLIVRLISLALFSLVAVGAILTFFKNFSKETIYIIVLLGLYHIFFSIADVFLAEFKGHDRMALVALLSIFVRFVISSAGILLIILHFDFLTVLTCFPLGSFIYLLVCIYLSSYYFKSIRPQMKGLHLKSLFVTILPFAFAIILVETLYHLDILMLRFLKDDQAVGIFSAANKVIVAILGINVFVHTALLPTFSRLFVDAKSELIEISKQSLRFLLLIGLPMSIGLFALSDRLIVFLFSDRFVYSGGVLKLLSWTIAIGFAAALYSVLLTAINRQKEKVIGLGICLGLNFLFDLLLIPQLSYTGAAAAKLIAEALHLFVMLYLASRFLALIPVHKIFLKPALSCLFMYIFIQFFDKWNLMYLIPSSALVYALSLGIMRGYSKEETEFIKRLFLKIFFPSKFLKAYGSKKQ